MIKKGGIQTLENYDSRAESVIHKLIIEQLYNLHRQTRHALPLKTYFYFYQNMERFAARLLLVMASRKIGKQTSHLPYIGTWYEQGIWHNN